MTGLPASLRLPRKPAGTARQGFGATSRLDDWATEPGIVAFGFTAFILYSLFSALLLVPAVRRRRTRSTATSRRSSRR